MKRRKFLQLISAAFSAPAIPTVPVSVASAGYSKATLHAAIYHAQSRVSFSVFGLAQQLDVSINEAEALMADMSARGILGPIQGTTYGGRWASSNVLVRRARDVAASVAHEGAELTGGTESSSPRLALDVDLSRLLAHLKQICETSNEATAQSVSA